MRVVEGVQATTGDICEYCIVLFLAWRHYGTGCTMYKWNVTTGCTPLVLLHALRLLIDSRGGARHAHMRLISVYE